MTRQAQREGRDGGEDRISPWEWVVGAAGLLVVLAAVVLLGREAMRPTTPPDVSIRFDSVSATRGAFVAHFTARNAGSAPASNVDVEGTLTDGRDTTTSQTHLDYLPGTSSRRGALFFPVDPRTRELRMRALGYEAP